MVLIRKTRSGLKIIREDINYFSRDKQFTLTNINYEDYWKVKGSSGLKERFKIFANYIEEGSSVLDIGCGDGTCLEHLSKKKNVSGDGIDISSTAVESAKEKGINAWVDDINTDEFSINRQYDYIIISEVLEHLPNPEKLLFDIRDKFKKNLIITFPNIGLYRHRIRLLLGRFPIQWAFHPGEHLRFWTIKDFRTWIKALDYKVVDLTSTNGFPMLHRFFPELFGHQILVVLEKIN